MINFGSNVTKVQNEKEKSTLVVMLPKFRVKMTRQLW